MIDPASGFRDRLVGCLRGNGGEASSFSSSNLGNANIYASYLRTGQSFVQLYPLYGRSYGFTVRCVQELVNSEWCEL